MIAGRLLEADILYQTGALAFASQRLSSLASGTSQDGARQASLCRLTEIACDLGNLADAQGYLAEMQRIAEAGDSLSVSDRAELNYAMARCAFSSRDRKALERGVESAFSYAQQMPGFERSWSLAARLNAYLAVDRYHRQDLASAGLAAQAALRALRSAPGALPYVKTHALTTRAVIDLHDPDRAHLATAENVEALEIALSNGMLSTARDALFNIVNFWLYCDDYCTSSYEASIARKRLQDVMHDPPSAEDPVLVALAFCSFGRYTEALRIMEPRDLRSSDNSSSWLPLFFAPVTATKRARIFFKARRYVDAEQAAGEALRAWGESGLGGEGTALRVRAEALEALGRVREAREAIDGAIGALQPMQPMHHMIGAYKCAYRLTNKRTYSEQARYLIAALGKNGKAGQKLQLTPREREIALLVAQGHTNNAIAGRLHLSVRTVENHVASIFEQLAIRARWQLTTELIQQPATPNRRNAP